MLEDQAIWENERMFEIFGHAPEDGTIGKTEFLNDILHPDDRPAVRRAISKALREDGDPAHQRPHPAPQSDGAWRTIDMAGRFERDAPGRLPRRLIGVVADVTDRRLAEERQSLLIRELHHRVKNTLATVQAIVGSTARDGVEHRELLRGLRRAHQIARPHPFGAHRGHLADGLACATCCSTS